MIDITVDDFAASRYIYKIGVEPIRIDISTCVPGLEFGEAWTRATTGRLAGIPVKFLCIEDLLRAKEAAGRDKDQADIRAIRRRIQKMSGE